MSSEFYQDADKELWSDFLVSKNKRSSSEDKVDLKLPHELLHFTKVLEFGAEKYGSDNWLEEGVFTRERYDSMFHHLAKVYSGIEMDEESGLNHLLHLAANALMMYTVLERGILQRPATVEEMDDSIAEYMCEEEDRINSYREYSDLLANITEREWFPEERENDF
jgi:hypothetical protein